jgi:hypothetical protein
MILKEAVAYLFNNGAYSCSNDLNAELKEYHTFLRSTQEGVDRAREISPEWTEERLRAYANGGAEGQLLIYIKDCLDSLGYDTSTLPNVIVPEFPVPGMAGLITAGGMGAMIAYTKAKSWFYSRKESRKSEDSTPQ